MRKGLLCLCLLCSMFCFSQNRADSLEQIRRWAGWLDLEFTVPEADSMLDDLRDYSKTYKSMHKVLPENRQTTCYHKPARQVKVSRIIQLLQL